MNQKKTSSNKTSLMISGALVVVLAGVLGFVALKEPEPIRKPKPLPKPLVVPGSVRKNMDANAVSATAKTQPGTPLETSEEIAKTEPGNAENNKPKRPKRLEGTVQALKEDLLDVAPGVYTGVRLATEGDSNVDEGAKIDQLLKRLNVSYVEITASAGSWDKLKSDAKVDLLYGTFALLKKQYPTLSQYVRVVFDDGRQALDLKFDDFRDVIEAG